MMIDRRKKMTLCWKCSRACGKCSWSKNFTPVEGWRAKPTQVRESHAGTIESYIVYDCPLFDDDTANYRPNNKIAPPTVTEPKRRNISNMSPIRREVETLPTDELERRINTISRYREIARLALIEHRTYNDISAITRCSYDVVKNAVSEIVRKIAEAV